VQKRTPAGGTPLEGSFVEDGYFLLDRCTGDGFYYVTAAFTGTVLGSKPGTATFKADGRIRNSTIIITGTLRSSMAWEKRSPSEPRVGFVPMSRPTPIFGVGSDRRSLLSQTREV
jgi:hypothetical protein